MIDKNINSTVFSSTVSMFHPKSKVSEFNTKEFVGRIYIIDPHTFDNLKD